MEKATEDFLRTQPVGYVAGLAKEAVVDCIFTSGRICPSNCTNQLTILSTRITFGLFVQEIKIGGDYSRTILGGALEQFRNEQISMRKLVEGNSQDKNPRPARRVTRHRN